MSETVWWCEEHHAEGLDGTICVLAWATAVEATCRMVEMVLAPKGSLVIEKVDGEWPVMAPWLKRTTVLVVLDALLAAQEEESDV